MLPAAAIGGATSPLVNCCLLGQANCKRYSVLILDIALLNWLDGSVDVGATSCTNQNFYLFVYSVSKKDEYSKNHDQILTINIKMNNVHE